MQAGLLDAGDLGDGEPRAGEPAVDQGLDLEAVAPQHRRAGRRHQLVVGQVEERDQVGPERVVAVAEVGEPGPERDVHPGVEEPVAEPADGGDVGAAATGPEPRALGEVGALEQRLDEARDLLGVGRPVGVEHHHDVAGDPREPGRERVALAAAHLGHGDDPRERLAGGLDRPVDRAAVDQDHLVDFGKGRQHLAQVPGLVEGRDDDADPRLARARRSRGTERRLGARDSHRPAGHLRAPRSRQGSSAAASRRPDPPSPSLT